DRQSIRVRARRGSVNPGRPYGAREGARSRGTEALVRDPSVKNKLRANTDEALTHGVWGVPTFLVGEELFWGADTFPMMLDYLKDPGIFGTSEMSRMMTLPVGASREYNDGALFIVCA